MKFPNKIAASIVIAICLFVVSGALVTGCNTSQQKVAYNTIYSVEKGVTASYDGYLDTVITGKTPTNSVPAVSKAYNHFQGGVLIALDAVQFNTNALAPANLVQEGADVINLIGTFNK